MIYLYENPIMKHIDLHVNWKNFKMFKNKSKTNGFSKAKQIHRKSISLTPKT